MLWLVSTLLLGLVAAGCVITFIISAAVPDEELDREFERLRKDRSS